MNSRRACLLLFAAAVMSQVVTLFAQAPAVKSSAAAAKSAAKTVTLTIAFPDDVEVTYKAISFQEGMTVLDALTAASKHARPLKFKYTGSGEFAFLTEIDNVKNEGAAGKNWTFQVDGARAKVGMGSMKLKEGNHILWLFGG